MQKVGSPSIFGIVMVSNILQLILLLKKIGSDSVHRDVGTMPMITCRRQAHRWIH